MTEKIKPLKGPLLHEGKCKKVFKVENSSDKVLIEFKDNLTAYNGKKKSQFKGKGALNRDTSSLIFQHLKNIPHHWIENYDKTSIIAQSLKMIPLEVVVRNIFAGSTAKKFQKKEGEKLKTPLFEIYYKNESLDDPFISSEQAEALNISSLEDIHRMKELSLKINQQLCALFYKAGITLVDFKVEFGKNRKDQLVLGDEISADSCRLWQGEKRLDKDRFRLDLGEVEGGYRTIYQNLYQNL